MKSGKCPKCGSENIFVSSPKKILGHIGNWIFIKSGWTNKGAFLIHYVCDDCRYTESYVADTESMKHIRENWQLLYFRKSKHKNDES